jgi:uncharacterized protein YkuJ
MTLFHQVPEYQRFWAMTPSAGAKVQPSSKNFKSNGLQCLKRNFFEENTGFQIRLEE